MRVLEKILLVSIWFWWTSGTLVAQVDSTKLEFYPLQIGNTWQYNNGPSVIKIVGDTSIAGEHYFQIANPDYPQNASFVRVDSLYRVMTRGRGDTSESNRAYRLNESVGSIYEIPVDVAGVVCLNANKYMMKYVAYVEDAIGPGMDAMLFDPIAADTVQSDTCDYGFQFVLIRGLGIYREEYEADQYKQLTGAIVGGVQWGTIVSVQDHSGDFVAGVQLEQNYPNPFNSTTTIRFSLPRRSEYELDVYDVLGRHIRTIANGDVEAGSYSIGFDLWDLPSGVYFCRLSVGSVLATRKMILSR